MLIVKTPNMSDCFTPHAQFSLTALPVPLPCSLFSSCSPGEHQLSFGAHLPVTHSGKPFLSPKGGQTTFLLVPTDVVQAFGLVLSPLSIQFIYLPISPLDSELLEETE